MVNCELERPGGPQEGAGGRPPGGGVAASGTVAVTPTSLLNNLTWSPPPEASASSPADPPLGSPPVAAVGAAGPRGQAPLRGLTQHPALPEFNGFVRPLRPPFFIREIYKNGFLKRLPYNEKKSSALAKLMKSDRFWVVFSVHDDVHPFLELWNEPTEVATKPPVYIFPLVACQHISPSIIPADSEWTFVVNFDTVAIRFACNSREVMDDWVEVIRNKLGDMGILNPKGNLYSKVPLGNPISKPVIRDPTSPLPQPPLVAANSVNLPAERDDLSPRKDDLSPRKVEDHSSPASRTMPVIETSSGETPSFTTSIYLNQPRAEQKTRSSLIVNRKTSLPHTLSSTTKVNSISLSQSMADVTISGKGKESQGVAAPSTSQGGGGTSNSGGGTSNTGGATSNIGGGKSSVYLNNSSPTRHVTVIPINSEEAKEKEEQEDVKVEFVEYENHTYGAIFEFDEKPPGSGEKPKVLHEKTKPGKRLERSPRRGREPRREGREEHTPRREEPPPLPHRPVLRRLSERKQEGAEGPAKIQKKDRRKSRRSSSLGPLLDSNQLSGDIGASTLSLESVESNPRQAVPKSDRGLGAIPRRPIPAPSSHPLLGSPTRNVADLPPGVRPPPYHPLAASLAHPLQPGHGPQQGHGPPQPGHGLPQPGHGPAGGTFPLMVPLPGLTCQLSIPGGLSALPAVPHEDRGRTLRDQQVVRLRQELAHPAGVRLILRYRGPTIQDKGEIIK